MPYKDPIAQKEAQHRSYLRNREKILQGHKDNADNIKEYKRHYRKLNRSKINTYDRWYRATHPEYVAQQNEYNREWRTKNQLRVRAYKLAHPEHNIAWNELRRKKRAIVKLLHIEAI